MNQARSPTLVPLLVTVGFAITSGCRNDPQMIVIAPRNMATKAEPLDKSRKKSFLARGETPRSRPLPPSNGVDVPIIEGK